MTSFSDEEFETLSPEDVKLRLWEVYEDTLRTHDWTYEYSDDHEIWCRGNDSMNKIRDIKSSLNLEDKTRANKLYWKYSYWHNEDGTKRNF